MFNDVTAPVLEFASKLDGIEQNIRCAFSRLYRRRVSAGARHIVP